MVVPPSLMTFLLPIDSSGSGVFGSLSGFRCVVAFLCATILAPASLNALPPAM